jgi:hypothetical protein
MTRAKAPGRSRLNGSGMVEKILALAPAGQFALMQITPNRIDCLSIHLRDKLYHGAPELRQTHAQLVMDEDRVS